MMKRLHEWLVYGRPLIQVQIDSLAEYREAVIDTKMAVLLNGGLEERGIK